MKAGQLLVPEALREKLDEILPSSGLGNGLAWTTDEVVASVTVETAIEKVVVTAAVASWLDSECAAARLTSSRLSTSSCDKKTHLPCTKVGTLESTIKVSRGCGGSGNAAAALKAKQTSNNRSDVHCNRGL